VISASVKSHNYIFKETFHTTKLHENATLSRTLLHGHCWTFKFMFYFVLFFPSPPDF